jgi:hypothetical protein
MTSSIDVKAKVGTLALRLLPEKVIGYLLELCDAFCRAATEECVGRE